MKIFNGKEYDTYEAPAHCRNCKKDVTIEVAKGHSVHNALTCDYDYRIPCPTCGCVTLEEL